MPNLAYQEYQSQHQTVENSPEFSTLEQFRLKIHGGNGPIYVSIGERILIGSDPNADFQVPGVLPFQCKILVNERGIELVDLGKEHNTFVNGIAISQAHLPRAAQLRIGNNIIEFEKLTTLLHMREWKETRFKTLIGNSIVMRRLFRELDSLLKTEEPVLIEGDIGTGKTEVARVIHIAGKRSSGIFFVVDCSKSYQEVEKQLIAAFEQGHGGTLLLQRVNEMPEELQQRLLRVFQNGGPGALADLRVISSSSINMYSAINRGQFNSKLFKYLSSKIIEVPSLSDRQQDFTALVESMLRNENVSIEYRTKVLSIDNLERLKRRTWPGNIRGLRLFVLQNSNINSDEVNVKENSNVVSELPDIDILKSIKIGREEWVKHFERLYLAEILVASGGNVTKAAKSAGVDRGHFYRLMMRSGLRNSG